MFEAEVKYRDHEGIFQLPTVRVNQFQIHGRLSCKKPIYQQSCQVFKAICAGFAAGTAPAVCTKRNTCLTTTDCYGQCGGDWSTDACGQCRSPDDKQRNSCLSFVFCLVVFFVGKEGLFCSVEIEYSAGKTYGVDYRVDCCIACRAFIVCDGGNYV